MKNQPHWERIIDNIYQITGEHVRKEPWICLFHDTDKRVAQYKNTLVPHLLNAAKSLIPRVWRTPDAPSMKEWIVKIDWLRSIEETIHRSEDSMETYKTVYGRGG